MNNNQLALNVSAIPPNETNKWGEVFFQPIYTSILAKVSGLEPELSVLETDVLAINTTPT